MTLTEYELGIVNKYIIDNDARQKLIEYLARHDTVGKDIFPYLGEFARIFTNIAALCGSVCPKETFIRRIPFYFYKADRSKKHIGDLQQYINGILRGDLKDEDEDYELNLVKLYSSLELLLYHFEN